MSCIELHAACNRLHATLRAELHPGDPLKGVTPRDATAATQVGPGVGENVFLSGQVSP